MLNNFFIYAPLLVKLSEKEKKSIGIIVVIILFVLFLVGLIARLLLSARDKQGNEVESYMKPFVQFGIIKNASEFKSYVFRRESKRLYLRNRLSIRIAILVAIALILYINIALKGDASVLQNIFKDFFPVFEIPKTEIFGLKIISNWPQLVQAPIIHLDINGYITYISMIVAIFVAIRLICSSFAFSARIDKANKLATKANYNSLGSFGGNNDVFNK